MSRPGRLLFPWILALFAIAFSPLAFAQDAAPAAVATPSTALTPDAMEAFLVKARIVSRKDAGGGVTNSIRATLSDGTLTHDAQIQTIDVSQTNFQAGKATELNFKDSYRYNIAGYRLAHLLRMNNVPMSVERRVEAKMAAMTWWIDDVKLTEKDRLKEKTAGPSPLRTTNQLLVMKVFDELIQNKDRNQGNILWTGDWKMWLIDHTRAFRTSKEVNPANMTRCDRAFLERLRAVTPQEVEQALSASLTKTEIDALLARRDAIVKHFDARIAQLGEAVVLFDLNPPMVEL